jgi:mannose-6-phosphate isomerase-like protein (cupin superfamily)
MNTPDHPPRYRIADFNEISPVVCPCGLARRALVDTPEFPGTIHRTEIRGAAKTHYHQRLTETYYILECQPDAKMELDDRLLPIHPGMCIVIPPGVRHRAVGHMTVLIIVLPKFDPADEVVVEEEGVEGKG